MRSAPTTSTFLSFCFAKNPAATSSMNMNAEHAAFMSNAMHPAPSLPCISHDTEGRTFSPETVAPIMRSSCSGVIPALPSARSAAFSPMSAAVSPGRYVTSFHSDSLCYPLVVCFHDLRKIVVRYDFFGNVHSRTFYIKAHMRTPILKNPGGCIRTDSAAPVFRLLLIVSAGGIEKVTLFRKKFRRSSDFSFCSQTYPKKAIQYD